MAKIALESTNERTGQSGRRLLACSYGWSISDMPCTAGPHDRPFEEQHDQVCIAIVVEGSFQYRSDAGRELMTPGSLLLGNTGQYFECGHEHGTGDRCISFSYAQQFFEDIAAEADLPGDHCRFSVLRVPPLRELSGLVAQACANLSRFSDGGAQDSHKPEILKSEWEEIAVELAAVALDLANGRRNRWSLPSAEARTTRVVRMIEARPDTHYTLHSLSREARLSRYHFIRVFRELTGLTPHQYVRRARLRRAAMRLILEPARVLDIALESGFGDVSNFNRAFRAEFGASPLRYRRKTRHRQLVGPGPALSS